MTDKTQRPFVCVHNAGRSQMAAAWPISARPHRGAVRWFGAPADNVNPSAVAMAGRGIEGERGDLEDSDERGRSDSDVVITMGCVNRPTLPGQAVRGLGTRRSRRSGHRCGAADPRRDPAAGGRLDRRTRALGLHGICQRDRVERRCSVGVIVEATRTHPTRRPATVEPAAPRRRSGRADRDPKYSLCGPCSRT